MNIADLKNKIWHLPNDTQIAIIPSDDDREESQLKMNWDMWSRTRIKDKGQVLILSFPFGKTEIESELETVKAERDELKEFVEKDIEITNEALDQAVYRAVKAEKELEAYKKHIFNSASEKTGSNI